MIQTVSVGRLRECANPSWSSRAYLAVARRPWGADWRPLSTCPSSTKTTSWIGCLKGRGLETPGGGADLSRESDELFEREATRSNGAILVSFWQVPGMPSDSGTPTDWLQSPTHHLINVRCACEFDVAANRFLQRRRHPGHLDGESSSADVLASLRTLTQLPALDLGQRIDVDTSQQPNLTDVVAAIRGALMEQPEP